MSLIQHRMQPKEKPVRRVLLPQGSDKDDSIASKKDPYFWETGREGYPSIRSPDSKQPFFDRAPMLPTPTLSCLSANVDLRDPT